MSKQKRHNEIQKLMAEQNRDRRGEDPRPSNYTFQPTHVDPKYDVGETKVLPRWMRSPEEYHKVYGLHYVKPKGLKPKKKESNMVEIRIHNTRSQLVAADPSILRVVSDHLSYEIPGHQFANIPGWDGRKRLLGKSGHFPTGLTLRLLKFLKYQKVEFKVTDGREVPKPTETFKADFGEKVPRYYQSDAAALSDTKARGVFNLGTGAGKSLISAMVTDLRKVPTLFVTPDTGLRKQAYNQYVEWFGQNFVSDDVLDCRPIIIANIQSLAKKDPNIFARFKMLQIDEFHHAAASTYLDLNKWCINAYYRYGYTGTFTRTDGTDMTMHGVLSNVIFRKSTSELIEEGFLVRPYITMKEVVLPKSKMNYKEAYDFITDYVPFNNIVADIANDKIKEGKQTLVLVRRKEHGRNLAALIPGAVFVSGNDKGKERERIKKDFIDKKLRCLIATEIFGEGQDIPTIDVLVNARAQKTEIQTSQGIGRALRKAEGKDKAEVFDFLFVGQRHLANHSAERLMAYKREPAFKVSIQKETAVKFMAGLRRT